MAYQLAKANASKSVQIGEDNNYIGGQNFWRRFSIYEQDGYTLLVETKTTASFADFTRTFQVHEVEGSRLYVREYIKDGENYSKTWVH